MNNLKWHCIHHIPKQLEYVMLILTIFSLIGGGVGHENPKLTMDLLNSGFHRFVMHFLLSPSNSKSQTSQTSQTFPQFRFFHRELKYGVIFPDLQGQQNTFLIKQRLPASVYVSTDQLNDLQRLDKVFFLFQLIQCLSEI